MYVVFNLLTHLCITVCVLCCFSFMTSCMFEISSHAKKEGKRFDSAVFFCMGLFATLSAMLLICMFFIDVFGALKGESL